MTMNQLRSVPLNPLARGGKADESESRIESAMFAPWLVEEDPSMASVKRISLSIGSVDA